LDEPPSDERVKAMMNGLLTALYLLPIAAYGGEALAVSAQR
jgi:hypothetical protein